MVPIGVSLVWSGWVLLVLLGSVSWVGVQGLGGRCRCRCLGSVGGEGGTRLAGRVL